MHLLTGDAVPVVPFAFEGLLGAVTMMLFLAAIVLFALSETWRHTIGYGLRWLANEIENVGFSVGWFGSVHPFGFLARALRSVDHVVAHALSVAALNAQNSATTMWHMTATVFWWSVHETKDLAFDTWHALDHTTTVTVPNAAKWAKRSAITEAKSLVHREAGIRRVADAEIGHLARLAGAEAITAEHAAAHALDWSEAQVGHIGKEIAGIRARLRQVERLLTPVGVVGLVIAALGSLGLGFLRCPSFAQLGRKRGCGLWNDLETLLSIAFIGLEIATLEEQVKLGQKVVEEVTTIAADVLRV